MRSPGQARTALGVFLPSPFQFRSGDFESRHEYAIAPTTTSRDNRSMYEGESFTLAGRRRNGSASRFSAQSRGTWFATPETSIDTLYSLNFFFGRSCEEC